MDTKKMGKDIQPLGGSLTLQTKLIVVVWEQSSKGKMVDLISMGHVAIGVWPEHQIQTVFLAIHTSLSTHTKKPLTFACNTVNSGCNGFAVLDLIKLIKINAKYEFCLNPCMMLAQICSY